MKRCLILGFAAVLLLFSIPIRAQELTKADEEKALQYLESTKRPSWRPQRVCLQPR